MEFFIFSRILDILILDFGIEDLAVYLPFYLALTFFFGFLASISLLTDGIFELCYVFKCWLCCLVVLVDLLTIDFAFFFLYYSANFAKIANFNFSVDLLLPVSTEFFIFPFYFSDRLVCLLEYFTLTVSIFSLLRTGLKLLRVDLHTFIRPVDADFLIFLGLPFLY